MNQPKQRFSDYFYNPITFAGVLLSIAVFTLEITLFGIDYYSRSPSLYLGLITYFLLPPFLFLGALLIPIGAWWKKRRIAKGVVSRYPVAFVLDLSKQTHRNGLFVFLAVSSLIVITSVISSYRAYHYTESVSFCGQLCHVVMKPEFTRYRASPHARVKCVECHIGEGADWFVKSKLSGMYQVYSVLFKKYSRPIPTPVHNLRPSRETCEQCHWPDHFFSAKEKIFRHFLGDAKNTPWNIRMLMNIGGGGPKGIGQKGIHWHMVIHSKLRYVSRTPDRQQIAWIKVTSVDGSQTEYVSKDHPPDAKMLAPENQRTMDCMDCHNRPSHRFPSPVKAVDEALVGGDLDPALPSIKANAVRALAETYADDAQAKEKIASALKTFYAKEDPARVAVAAAAVQQMYAQIQFPAMKANWKAYPDNIGHKEFPGCFRCHGSDLTSKDGKKIPRDCNACHTILSQGLGPMPDTISTKGMKFEHPVDVGVDMTDADCTACHTGGSDLYS